MMTNWPRNREEARQLQERDRHRIKAAAFNRASARVAAVDAAFDRGNVYAAVCLYQYPEMSLVEQAAATAKSIFPYIPGYLLFLEGPAMMLAVKGLKTKPDIILVDGQGIAHPRGIGSAAHLGLLLDIPTIGCAKTRLVGTYREPGSRKGNWEALVYCGRTVGAVVRTRDNVQPLFVSPGHRMDLKSAIHVVLTCASRYRIPEPLRCSDILSRKMRSGSVKT